MFLPPPSKLEMVEDDMIVSSHRKYSTVDKQFIENKQDNSVQKLK